MSRRCEGKDLFRPPDVGIVDHHTLKTDGTVAGCLCKPKCFDHLPRSLQLVRSGREDPIYHRHLAGMYGGLSIKSMHASYSAFSFQGVVVAKIDKGAI